MASACGWRELSVLSWSKDYFQQAGFAGVKAIEPCGTVFERCDLGDERLHFDSARRNQMNGLWVFAGRGAGALEANLAADNFLQMDFYFGGEIADQSDGTAFADGVDAVGDGFGAADGFEDGVNAVAVGEIENLLCEVRFRIEDFRGAEIFCHFEA